MPAALVSESVEAKAEHCEEQKAGLEAKEALLAQPLVAEEGAPGGSGGSGGSDGAREAEPLGEVEQQSNWISREEHDAAIAAWKRWAEAGAANAAMRTAQNTVEGVPRGAVRGAPAVCSGAIGGVAARARTIHPPSAPSSLLKGHR